jgi:hypothetical protein
MLQLLELNPDAQVLNYNVSTDSIESVDRILVFNLSDEPVLADANRVAIEFRK